MKKFGILFTLIFFAFVTQSYAQAGKFGATPEDSVECVKYLSFYKDYYKNGNIREALPSWRGAVRICPVGVTQSLYQDGQNIIKYLINQAKDPAQRAALVDSLFLMYDIRIEKFPTSKSRLSAYTYKAYDMITFCKDNEEPIFKALQDVINFGGANTDHGILVYDMQYAVNLFKAGKLNAQQVIEEYDKLGAIFEKKAAGNGDDAFTEARNNFETIFAVSGVADCDNLLALFGPKFESNSNNLAFVKRVVQLLSNAGCERSDLFLNAVEALYKMEPSYTSAYYLYRLYSSRDDNDAAVSFLQKAIDNDSISQEIRADYLLELGTFYFKKMNNNPMAADAARKAIEQSDAIKGKAYLLLGHIWAMAKATGGTEIDTRANFWVAVDYFARAKAADSTLAEECDKLTSTYRQYFPTIEEAFMHDLSDGSSYTVTAPGMSATTTVRTKK